MLGFYRLVSGETLVVGENLFKTIKVKHKGTIPSQVELIEQVLKSVVTAVPLVFNRIDQMKATKLTLKQKQDFAEKAIAIRLGLEEVSGSMDMKEVLSSQEGVIETSLWDVFNTVQENLINCPPGITIAAKSGKVRKARAISNINREINIRKQLWDLAESFIRV